MCAAICWMLQAWLPPTWRFWADAGGAASGLFSYWINTYTGGGFIAALGGALVMGALPRFMRAARLRDGLLMGLVPYSSPSLALEGLLLCLPVAVVLMRWLFFGKNRPAATYSFAAPLCRWRWSSPPGHGWRTTTIAHLEAPDPALHINRDTYAMARTCLAVTAARASNRHEAMRHFYYLNELTGFEKIHTLSGFVRKLFLKR